MCWPVHQHNAAFNPKKAKCNKEIFDGVGLCVVRHLGAQVARSNPQVVYRRFSLFGVG